MTQPYGREDIDYRTDGDPNSGYVFNAADSTFFRRIRNLMYDKLAAMYLSRETANAWSASGLIAEFDNWQNMFCEELWRLDAERKYYRTYYGGTKRFLETMMNGRKRYHRRQWERDQEAYMGTKYVSADAKADQIMFRCNTPQQAIVTPNYDLRIVPYSDMYICVLYGNSSSPIRIRAKAGVEYEILNPLGDKMDDTAVLIYRCSRIQALNDLSGCYIHDNDFSKASKLQRLIIGNDTDGYSNTFLTELNIGNNKLLQVLNVRNCPNLVGSVNLTNCGNLETFYADGTSLTGVTFAPNGKIRTAYLPDTINSLTAKNLNHLTDLRMSYDNLESLTIENSEIIANGEDDVLAIVTYSADTVQTLRLVGVDWQLPDTMLLNQILKMNSSTLIGRAYISGAIRNQELLSYESAWSDFEVTYNAENLVTQYLATYVNANGDYLYSEYVDRGSIPSDPVSLGFIPKPTLESTAQYNFEFSKWDDIESTMLAPRTITAVYNEILRSYTVTWYSRAGLSLGSVRADYNSEVVYPGENPVNTDEESSYVYKLFAGWDKSTGRIVGDTDVYAIWERVELPSVGKDIADMSATEIYGIASAGLAEDYFELKDYHDLTLGHDFNFSNVESEVLAENLYLDGSTSVNTGISLFGESEESFTLAIDFQFTSKTSNNTLLACYEEDGSEGFRLRYSGSPNIQWGNVSQNVGYSSNRDIIVIRHIKGDDKLHVYASNGASNTFATDICKYELTRNRRTSTDANIVLGAIQFLGDGGYDNYGKGFVHWCKIWHDDLGEHNAMQLASWCHETLRLEFCGANRYRLAGNTSKRANISFIANNLLSDRDYWMNSENTNDGGWDAALMRELFNSRLYNALPTVWQSFVKKVKINASAGNQSQEILISEDYVYPPSYTEISGNASTPYINEGEHIEWYTSDALRAKFKGRIVPDDATYYSSGYEPSSISTNSVKEGDIWRSSTGTCYMYLPQDEIDKYNLTVGQTAAIGGGWISAANWWTRSANSNYSTYFMLVYQTGNVNLNVANSFCGICVCISA